MSFPPILADNLVMEKCWICERLRAWVRAINDGRGRRFTCAECSEQWTGRKES